MTAGETGRLAPPQLPAPPTLLDTAAPTPPPHVRGAWVEHLLAPRSDRVSVLVSEALQLPQDFVQELLRFGAVHSCPVPPPLPAAARAGHSPVAAAAAAAARAAAVARNGRGSEKRTPQRLCGDPVLEENSYIRVHVNPKRFPAVYEADWRRRIILDAPEFLVVNKPHSVPAVPTVDNLVENALACAAAAVGHPSPLFTTSRLDQCTEGVLVLGKTKEFVAHFNGLIQTEGATRKLYRALAAAPPPLGPMRHHLSVAVRVRRAPRVSIAHEVPVAGALPCELRVLEARRVALTGAAAARWGPHAHECLVELVTGRTHQIRAQLSAAGCPLLGDNLYAPLADARLRRAVFEADPAQPLLDPGSGERLLREPEGGIGLQACRLEAGSARLTGAAPAVFEAGPPWWRA